MQANSWSFISAVDVGVSSLVCWDSSSRQ